MGGRLSPEHAAMMREMICQLLAERGPLTNNGVAEAIREEVGAQGTMPEAYCEGRGKEWSGAWSLGLLKFGWQIHAHMVKLESEGRVTRVQAVPNGTILWYVVATPGETDVPIAERRETQ